MTATIKNLSTAILLVNDAVQVVLASYDVDANTGKAIAGSTKPYKTFDRTLKVGDYVVVPTATRHNMTCARVEEVEHDLDIDFSPQLEWIIDRVDVAAFERVKQEEARGIDQIKHAEREAAKAELRDKVQAANPAFANLKNVGAGPALAAPPTEPPPNPDLEPF